MATPFLELEREIQKLAEENALLRQKYARERRGEFRRSGLALIVFGAFVLVVGTLGYTGTTLSSLFVLSGVGTVFVGVLTIFLTPERLVRSEVMHRGLLSSVRAIDGIFRDLGLRSNALYLPSIYKGKPLLVIPISEKHFDLGGWLKRPSEGVFVVGKSVESCGLAIEPLGASLLSLIKDELRTPPSDEADALSQLMEEVYTHGLDLCNAVELERLDGLIRVRFTAPLFLDFCMDVSKDAPFLCTNVGCPYCSLALLLVCESMKTPLKKGECTVLPEEQTIQIEAELYPLLRSP